MEMSNERILSEAIQYYEDFDGELEESLFYWLVKRAEVAEKYECASKEIDKSNEQLLEEMKSLMVKLAYNTTTGKERTRLKELEKIILAKMNNI